MRLRQDDALHLANIEVKKLQRTNQRNRFDVLVGSREAQDINARRSGAASVTA